VSERPRIGAGANTPLDPHAHHLVARPARREHPARPPEEEAHDDMVFAADYPFMDVLWTMIIFFCWVAWIWMLILIFSDLFRRDVSGWAKAAWVVFLIVLPFLGALVYLIANGKGMTERRVRDAAASQAHFDSYVRSVATTGDGGSAGEIERAKQLLDSGTITQEEFDQLKAKALA
jgi:general stress protein CsbA